MKWMERHYYLFLAVALVAALVACAVVVAEGVLNSPRPEPNLRELGKLSPEEVKAALEAFNSRSALKDRLDILGMRCMFVTLVFGSVGLGLLLRRKKFTAQGIVRSGARRWRAWSSAVALVAAAIALYVYESDTFVLRGLVKGENSYRDRPTSYWKAQFKEDGHDGGMRRVLVEAFAEDPAAAMPVLLDAFHDSDTDIRWVATALLGRSGEAAAGALPELTAALKDDHAQVRYYAMLAVANLSKDKQAALTHIIPMLADPKPGIAGEAINLYWWLDPNAAFKRFNWRNIESKEWGFRVALPPEGSPLVENIEWGFEDFANYRDVVWFNGDAFVVAVREFTGESMAKDTSYWNRTDQVAQHIREKFDGTVTRTKAVAQNGLSGDELIIKAPRVPDLRARFFWVGKRLYIVGVGAARNGAGSPQADFFLNSFALLNSAGQK